MHDIDFEKQVKRAEEGYADREIIVRAWSLDNKASKSSILFQNNIAEAYQASHVETDISVNPYSGSYLRTSIPAQGMNTYRLKFSSALK